MPVFRTIAALALIGSVAAPLRAQQPGQQRDTTMRMPMPQRRDTTMRMPMPQHRDTTTRMPMPQHRDTTMRMPMPDHVRPTMNMAGALGISMERMGSGTTWIPDAVRLPSYHVMAGAWTVMMHGFVFGQYVTQGGPRGDDQLGSLNWGMIMASRGLAGGHLQLRFMPSLDVATVGRCGYPLLLQSGETCHGAPLVDGQHPHDFFMELAALYERELTPNVAGLLYVAPAGEPALGPVAFMHRPSAMDDAMAPLGHHWQDATHIAFGVVTAGIFTRTTRLEISRFNSREPDENRWNFDPILLDSWSGRLTINPTMHWSLTAGYGRLANPERAVPAEAVNRLVASAMHGRTIGQAGQLTATVIYGRNSEAHHASNSVLAEAEAVLDGHNTVYGRLEMVQKTGNELLLPGGGDTTNNIAAASLGYVREVARTRGATLGLGARGTVNFVPAALETPYGSRTPLGLVVFLRLRPIGHLGGATDSMPGMTMPGDHHTSHHRMP